MIGNFKIMWDGDGNVTVSFFVYDESTAVASVSIGLAVNNYDYSFHIDPTGAMRSWMFNLPSLEMRVDDDSLLNAIVGVQDMQGNVRWFPFCRFLPVEVGRPYVDNLVASQRVDGSGIVDIYYDFISHEEVSGASVRLSLADGHGNGSVSSASAVGDLGDNIRSGVARHIVWNPVIDLPGTSSGTVVATIGLVGEGGVAPRGETTTGSFVIDTRYTSRSPYVVFKKSDEKSRYGWYDGEDMKNVSKVFYPE